MKNLKIFSVLIFAALFVMCGTAQAKDGKGDVFNLVNNTGKEITELYWEVDSTNKWSKNVIKNKSLKDGKSQKILLQPFERYFDFKIVFQDGTKWNFKQVDVFLKGSLTLEKKGIIVSSRSYKTVKKI
ncbi:MAG: hypothetical protein IK062_08330 [Selenomonadaceae bacterium]|nr:hypothetical protein [Selenomonadaceae bacterium]